MYLFLFFEVNIDADAIDDVDNVAINDAGTGAGTEFALDDAVLPFTKNSLLSSYSSGNEWVSGLLTIYNKWSLFKSLRYSSMDRLP